jgi:hypothetical protein
VAPPAPARQPDNARFGAAARFSLLGPGFDFAGRVSPRANVRAGINLFNYNLNFNRNGMSYAGHLSLKTMETHYDFFPKAGAFHVSPGMLIFLGDPVSATASAGPGEYFSLNGVSYVSSPTDPVTGSGKINFNRAAPEITAGFGNLVPRKRKESGKVKRITVPFEAGLAFTGAAKSRLNLSGSVCDPSYSSTGPAVVNCRTIDSDPAVQANIAAEQATINKDISALKVYPIVSLGIGIKF